MKHLLSIEDLNKGDIENILSLADSFNEVRSRSVPVVSTLRGKTIVLTFFEDSTRTKASFEIAAKSLSASTTNFSASSSSTNKGESLRDTIETISALGADCFVVRHQSSGVPQQITQWTDASIINAGDGVHQHPTQALLDSFTIQKKLGSLDGKRIAICGDINQRVARSNILAFTKLGAEVVVCGPETMMPTNIENWPVKVASGIDSVLADIDVMYLLRIQKERKGQIFIPSVREYRQRFGLTRDRAKKLNPDALIMHPGPMNRGVEIDPEVASDPRTIVVNQVSSGVPVRMAVLFSVLGTDSQINNVLDQPVIPESQKEQK